MWTLGVNPSRDSGFEPADVQVDASPTATVADLAEALGRHLSGRTGGGGGGDLGAAPTLVVPTEDGVPWPPGRPLAECGLRTGDVLDVVNVPRSWADRPDRPSKRRGVLRVVAGPDAGRSQVLTTSSATIGRGADCTVTLADPLVSRRHATLLLGPTPTITDEGSSHGTLFDGIAITGPTAIEWGRPIRFGDSAVVLERPEEPAEVTVASGAVLRPPRFGEPLAEGTIDLPATPTAPRPQPLQWAMMLMPMLLGAALFFQTRNIFSISYMVAWPLVMLATYWTQKRRMRKEHEEDLRLWREDVDEILAQLDVAADQQRLRAQEDHPEYRTLTARVQLRTRAVWQRRMDEPDFLSARIGIGPVDALLTAALKEGGDRKAAKEVRDELAHRKVLDALAVPAGLGDAALLAIAGPAIVADGVLRSLIARLACDHSPADLTIAAVLGRTRAAHETWLRWLPHTARRPSGAAPVAVGATDGAALLDNVLTESNGLGTTICIVDEGAGVTRRLVEAAASSEAAQEGRLHLIWLGDDPDKVPSHTSLLLDLTASVPAPNAERGATRPDRELAPHVAVLARRDRAGVQLLHSVDQQELADVWRLSRAMISCSDEAAVIPADTALPDTMRLPELVPDIDDPDDVAGILDRWNTRRGLRAQIGMGVGGVVSLDLREDGPHGLVAGTTGSGKSELLQTLMCSLALNSPPERLTFLLVDYKGGAAFRECADLPHTVGYLTDLTPALVQRALTSLGAEVSTRERLLEEYAAKDLRDLERRFPEVAPPSLLICVDEFAALTTEVPEFIDGMVNIAQRGRSLGMHLLLATQRPAGVVTGNIRANTDLRIALRVSSADDSNDVIDSPDAARISRRTPGRAWVRRTGHGTAELVQGAWVGAHAPLGGREQAVDVRGFSALRPLAERDDGDLDPRTDLERLVLAVQDAVSTSQRRMPRKPWLPALTDEVAIACDELGEVRLTAGGEQHTVTGAGHAQHASRGVRARVRSGEVAFGLLDRPADQAQGPAILDYAHSGHVLAYGASGTGKTELLRIVALSAALTEQVPPSIYGIDFGGGALGMLSVLPNVGAIVGETEIERVMRLLRMLRAAVADRNRLLASRGAADLGALADGGLRLPRIHVLIDNLPSLLDTLDSGGVSRRQHADVLHQILQDGRRVGVHVTATAPRRTGIGSGLQASFGQRLVLRMPTDDDYAMIGAPTGILSIDSVPGRGLMGKHEFQIATTGGAGTPVQAERLAAFAQLLTEVARAVGVPTMPSRLPQTMLPEPKRDSVPFAVEADFVSAVSASLCRAPMLVAGRASSGRTSLLAGLAQLARRSSEPPAEIVLVGPRAREHDGTGTFDTLIAEPDELLAWLPEFVADEGDAWRLVLVDDAHVWERGWDAGGAARDAVTALADLVAKTARSNVALVVATDSDDARTRQHVPGIVQATRRSRYGVLLSADMPDGSLLGVSVPMHGVEPMTGPGRGLLCEGGNVRIVQVVSSVTNGAPSPEVGA